MQGFATPKSFRAKPGKFHKRLFLVAGFIGLASVTWAATQTTSPNGAYAFAGGIALLAFSLRFWDMMVRNGPWELVFDSNGISRANKASRRLIAWADLKSIRYKIWRGSHYWEIASRSQDSTLDFNLAGLTGSQRHELCQTVAGLRLPNVQIVTACAG